MCNIRHNLHFSIGPLEINDLKRTALPFTLMCRGRDTNDFTLRVASHLIAPCVSPCRKKREQLPKLLPHCASLRTSLIHVYPHAGKLDSFAR